MKHCLTAILLGLVLWGCAPPESPELKQDRVAWAASAEQQRIAAQHVSNQNDVNNLTAQLVYFKDPRTKLCFVCLFTSYGQSISWVPGGSIPQEMLYIAQTPAASIKQPVEKTLP